MVTFGFSTFGGVDPVTEETIESTYTGLNSEIVEDLITLSGLTPNVVETTDIVIEEFKCIQATAYERIISLLESVDYQLRYDPVTRILNYEPRGYIDNGLILSDSDFMGIPKWEETRDGMINNLRIDGATTETQITETGQIGTTDGYTTTGIQLNKTPNIVELYMDASNPPTTQKIGGTKDASTVHDYWVDRESGIIMPTEGTTFTSGDYAKINYSWSAPTPLQDFRQDSIDLYGESMAVYTFNDITSVADAETRLGKILDTRSTPFKTGTLLLKINTQIQVGELITINDTMSVPGVSGTFVVNSVKRKYPSGYIEVTVGDKNWRLEDDIIELESRIKRLEEQFIRNQDLLLQLVRLDDDGDTNAKFTKERYIKVDKSTYNETNNIMIWDNPDYGVWDSSVWGGTHEDAFDTENVYVSSYNTYIEDFSDEDFRDDTSQTWGEMSSFQSSISKKITLNEKTINSCTIEIDYSTTGTFTLYLDNGNGWEEVTSSTHTFASSGNYIRWLAATADGNSTITKLQITY